LNNFVDLNKLFLKAKEAISISKENDLSKTINIVKDTETKLKKVGNNSFNILKSIGSNGAFFRLQKLDPGAYLS
jgi:hypothetical protein